jgi:hypothetical protein
MTEAQDGSLLVSDDGSNSIWRVSYTGNNELSRSERKKEVPAERP